MKVYWVATVNDGTTAIEHKGEFKIIPGQRKPWVRFVNKLQAEGKFLTSLRLRVGKRTIHLPRLDNNRFPSYPPSFYSLEYIAEVDDVLGTPKEEHFMVVGAHYENLAVRFIQGITDGNKSWICVTDNQAMAPSPIKREG